jgi:hypothetical protein
MGPAMEMRFEVPASTRKTIRNSLWMMFFSEGSFLCFCRGFWGKRVVEGGFLMVNLWWDCGDFVVN